MPISGPSIRKSTGAHFRLVGTEPSHLCGAGVPCIPAERDCFFKDGTVQISIGRHASVGPYARLRPGTSLGEGVRIGNFVETKAATLEAGAHVGANANLGAGTITCNYDGFFKHKTTIGTGAFIGTNSSLVAPVKIGNGAYIGSGSVITKDVPDDAMAVERSPQSNREGGAAKYREMKMRAKKPKEG
jgi:bifunctional UDP-N-acetylglucosamine pyrophosphorylase / glucosamine-1-phosphate N-acetyltransferase